MVALHEEAEHLRTLGLPFLVTGPGNVLAASSLARQLARSRPSEVINLGTAGALADGLSGIQHVGRVEQHDFDDDALHALIGRHFGPPIDLGAGVRLATGDRFVAGGAQREALAEQFDLVYMEGYAIAAGAARSWQESVAEADERLADWVRAELL